MDFNVREKDSTAIVAGFIFQLTFKKLFINYF